MKRIKKTVCFVLVVVFMSSIPLLARDITQVLTSAKQNSEKFKAIERSLLQSQNNYKIQTQSSDGTSISISVEDDSIWANNSFSIPAAKLEVSFPEFIDGLKLTGSALTDGKNHSVGADLSYSKSLTVPSTEDNSDELTLIQLWYNYNKSVLQFENSIIKDTVSLMQLETQVEESRTKYEKSKTSYENSLLIGEIEEGSLSDLSERINLEKTRVSVEASENNLENQKETYLHNYGIEFEPVSVSENPELDFELNENGNSSVYLAKVSMEKAKQNLDSATGNLTSLSVSGGVGSDYMFKDGNSSLSADVNAGISFSKGNLKLSTGVTSKYSNGEFSGPIVSVSGLWGTSSTNDASISNLNIKYLEAESSYNDSLYSYTTEAKSLKSEVLDYDVQMKQLELQIDYDQKILSIKQTLFEKGFCPEQDVKDAQTTLDKDYQQATILALNGIVLQNKIKIIEL